MNTDKIKSLNRSKTIIIFGGSGFLGGILADFLSSERYNIIIVSRNESYKKRERENIIDFMWDYQNDNILPLIENSFCIINLAGKNLSEKRWNGKIKSIIYKSRIETTKIISNLINKSVVKPDIFISGSATGYYGISDDKILNERSANGNDFLAKLCFDWEREALKYTSDYLRTIIIRIGIVLSKDGGALPRLVLPYKFFLGGKLGSGKQWMSWIHIKDFCNIILFSLKNNFDGPINLTSPEPIQNYVFNDIISEILKRPGFFTVPSFALKIIVGEFSEYLLTGQRVIPEKLLNEGYKFEYPDLTSALKSFYS